MVAVRVFALYFLFILALCSMVMLLDFGVYILLALLCAGVLTAKAKLVDMIKAGVRRSGDAPEAPSGGPGTPNPQGEFDEEAPPKDIAAAA